MREFLRHSAIYGLSDATPAFLGLLSTPILTRVFIPAEYGTRELIANTLTLITPVLLLGLDAAVPSLFVDPSKAARRRDYITTGLWLLTVWAVVALSATALVASTIAPEALTTPDARQALWLALASALPLTLVAYAKYVLRFRFEASAFAGLAVSSAILVTLVSLGAVTLGGLGLRGLYLGQLVGALVPCIASVWLIRSHLGVAFSRTAAGELLRVGLPFVPATLLNLAFTLVDRQILSAYYGPAEVGIYSVGVRIAAIPLTVATVASIAWYPLAVRAVHEGAGFSSLFASGVRYVVSGLALLALLISLFGREVVAFAAPPAYAAAAGVAAPLSFAVAISGFGTIAGAAIFVRRRPLFSLGVNTATFATNLALALILVPRFGMLGATGGVLAGQLVWNTAQLVIAQHLLPELVLNLRPPCLVLAAAIALAVMSETIRPDGLASTAWSLFLLANFGLVLIATGVLGQREYALIKDSWPRR